MKRKIGLNVDFFHNAITILSNITTQIKDSEIEYKYFYQIAKAIANILLRVYLFAYILNETSVHVMQFSLGAFLF